MQRSLHRCGILQIRSNRRDAGSGCRLACQAEDLPSLTDKVRGKIASDDAGRADNEGGSCSGSWLRLLYFGRHTRKDARIRGEDSCGEDGAVRDLNASDVASYVPVFRGEAELASVVEEPVEVERDGGAGFLGDFVFDGEIEVVGAVAEAFECALILREH